MSPNPKNFRKKKQQPPFHPQTIHFAKILNETEQIPRLLISKLLELCGEDFVEETLKEAFTTQAQGGLSVRTGTRQRTLGGVFFHIARNKVSPEIKKQVFLNSGQRLKIRRAKMARFDWKKRIEAFERLQTLRAGKVRQVKINLVGRPGKFEKHNGLVITTMKHEKGFPELPYALQKLPIEPTTYTVYIAENQWQQVYPLLRDPKEQLTIDGVCAYDATLQGISVFAHSVRTMKQRKAGQKAITASPGKPQRQPKATKPKATPSKPTTPKAGQKAVVVDPQYDAADQQKIRELSAAADLYRDKIAKLEASQQKFGIDMLRNLLKQNEEAISKIQKKYETK